MAMASDLVITKEITEPALDHEALFDAGLEHVQQLSSRIWTDYNAHDPGITTLELLAYAVTDLTYRAKFPIGDLLASKSDNAENMRRQFFTARQILPNRSLTLLDYRKLLTDVRGVKNAWLKPATVTYYANKVTGTLQRDDAGSSEIVPVNLAGLFDVTIDYIDGIGDDEKQNALKIARERLSANRNLCEDFVSFSAVATEDFILCAELELLPDADVDRVQAEILFQVGQYLAPAVPSYTLSEMLERKKSDGTQYSASEIFDGPALDCGFIDDEELAAAELRTEIRLSDIMSIIMDIKGVQAIRDIIINPVRTTVPLENKWVVPVASGKKAALGRTRLVYYKRTMPVEANERRANEYLLELTRTARTKSETKAEPPYDFDFPPATYRELSDYYSFQNHFPALYGLSEFGLGESASAERKAQSYQLKAYLLFFDQIMANYMAQLGHVKELFSTDESLQQTYFHQVVDSFAKYSDIYDDADGIVAELQTIGETPPSMVERRNRFLDHLIARFAERFSGYVEIMHSAFRASQADMTAQRCEFLNAYPSISSERALAYNYGLRDEKDLWNSENISGLEKRLARLLGIRNFTRRNLGEIAYDVYAEIDKTPENEFRFRVKRRDTGEIVLSSSTKYTNRELAKKEMRQAIRLASSRSGYQQKTTPKGKHYFNIIDDTGEVVARRIEYFDTKQKADRAIEELIAYLREHYSDEGMYLIENILLRPENGDDPFLPICPDPDCKECAELDPYSYRIHVILPAYSSRFKNMDFRRFVEEVIRSETPAHILPKICWISVDEMALLEKPYRDWIYIKAGKAGTETANRQKKLKAFTDILFTVRSIYPQQRLNECGGSEEQSKFIIGQSALGSMTDDDA